MCSFQPNKGYGSFESLDSELSTSNRVLNFIKLLKTLITRLYSKCVAFSRVKTLEGIDSDLELNTLLTIHEVQFPLLAKLFYTNLFILVLDHKLTI